MLRIISGKYKGRKLDAPENSDTRPTPDKVREALFGILQNEIDGAIFADLFCGSGAMGIEALSRGAKRAYFCETNESVFRTLKSNAAFCEDSETEFFKGDYGEFIRKASNNNTKFDIIFCDPPYRLRLGKEIAERVLNAGILKPEGLLLIERSTSDSELFVDGYNKISMRAYGNTTTEIFRLKPMCAMTGVFDPFTDGHAYLAEEALKSFSYLHAVILNNPEKTPMFSVEKRIEIMKDALKEHKKRVTIAAYDGLTVDYLKANGIKYIIRGVRNPIDFVYERRMAEWNLENGGVKTLIIPAKDPEISSSMVRKKLQEEKGF